MRGTHPLQIARNLRNALCGLIVALAMASGLAGFLEASRQTGRTLVEVVAPGHVTLLRADGAGIADVMMVIGADVEQRPATGELYSYTVKTGTQDGAQFSTWTEQAKGKRVVPGSDDDHRVDVASTNTAGAALGHVTRALIETNKLLRDNVKHVTDLALSDRRDVRELEQKARAADGEWGVQRLMVEAQLKSRDAWADRADRWIGQIVQMGGGALQAKGLIGQGQAVDQVAAFKASVSKDQRARIVAIVGAEAWAAVGWASTPDELADVLQDQVGEERARVVTMTCLDKAQAVKLVTMCGARWKANTEARKAKKDEDAKADAAAPEQGGAA